MINPIIAKDKIAVVVVGYNKLKGLIRLLESLNNAHYTEVDVPLVISVDASGNKELYQYVKDYVWRHGPKYVNIESERLGLKKHIFQCASFTKFFKGVIILEDDLCVSPYYYHYSSMALEYYGNNNKIAGISLYSEETNGFVGLPFQPEMNQYDVFAWQTVCSWGEIWNERMWNGFTSWLEHWDGDFRPIDMVGRIKKWPRAWSKYYYAYMITNDKFFIYPYQSLSTNFNDAGGEHGGGNTSVVQVSLLQGKKDYRFGSFNDLVKYDVYAQNLSIPYWLGIDEKEGVTVDFYGLKDLYKGKYILAPFLLPYKRIKGYALCMRPWELNIKYNITGEDIILYERVKGEPAIPPNRHTRVSLTAFFLREFNMSLLQEYVLNSIKQRIINKIRKNG